MKLTDDGEARVRGYLFVLGRSLRGSLAKATVADAVKEIESHIRERVAQAEATPSAQDALEAILAELGPPLRVAQAYAAEVMVDEALATGRFVAIVRALWHLATTTVWGFLASLGLILGYLTGLGLVAIAALKPVLPGNVGLIVVDGVPRAFGVQAPLPPGAHVEGGYWIILPCLVIGLAVLVLTHRGARRFLAWFRERRLRR
jgi:hypothetical protein